MNHSERGVAATSTSSLLRMTLAALLVLGTTGCQLPLGGSGGNTGGALPNLPKLPSMSNQTGSGNSIFGTQTGDKDKGKTGDQSNVGTNGSAAADPPKDEASQLWDKLTPEQYSSLYRGRCDNQGGTWDEEQGCVDPGDAVGALASNANGGIATNSDNNNTGSGFDPARDLASRRAACEGSGLLLNEELGSCYSPVPTGKDGENPGGGSETPSIWSRLNPFS